MLEQITKINGAVNGVVWGWAGLILLIGTGIVATLCTKVFQLSHLKHWWKNTIGSLFKKEVIGHTKEKGSVSPFQALCTALAATVGTGNIAGVAAAICVGGAGAVFWMWIAAFFGMMTNYSENVLGIFFRRKNANDEWSGGAMYYLRDGLGSIKYENWGCKWSLKWLGKVLAVLFCIFTMLAAFGIGSMGQVNKIVANVSAAFDVSALSSIEFMGTSLYNVILGVVIMALTALITLGGLKRIASVAEKVVPFMIVLFVAGGLVIIGVNYANILPALKSIFVNAFKPEAFVGGTLGSAIMLAAQQGFKRGVFSNEAGLGSSVMVHSNSNVKEPVKQGMWGIFEVFADTMVVCTMTALVVLTSGIFDAKTGEILAEGVTDATLVGGAFNTVFPWFNIGQRFVAIAMFLFAFTTVLGWSHYGAKAWEYLFGSKTTIIFKIIHVITVIFGAVLTSSLAWDISDTFNGLMMLPNLIGVIVMLPLVVKITKNYVDRKIKHKEVKPVLSYDEKIQAEAEEAIINGAE